MKKWLLLLPPAAFGGSLAAADYYLDPKGSADAAETRGTSWQTIGKANAALKSGDSAIFLPGTCNGCIKPARYRTAKNGTAIFTAANLARVAHNTVVDGSQTAQNYYLYFDR